MDLERLDKSITEWSYSYESLEPTLVAARAYRDLLANGERVEWCEEHGHKGLETVDRCLYAHFTGSERKCRIVSKLLIPSTEEEA